MVLGRCGFLPRKCSASPIYNHPCPNATRLRTRNIAAQQLQICFCKCKQSKQQYLHSKSRGSLIGSSTQGKLPLQCAAFKDAGDHTSEKVNSHNGIFKFESRLLPNFLRFLNKPSKQIYLDFVSGRWASAKSPSGGPQESKVLGHGVIVLLDVIREHNTR